MKGVAMAKTTKAILEDVKEDLENQGASEASTVGDLLDSLVMDENQGLWEESLDELISWARYAKKKISGQIKKTRTK